MPNIHPTAVVDPGAKLADDVSVGPLATIGGEVELGPGVEIGPQVCIAGRTRIGARTRIYPFAAIGLVPQVLGFDGRAGELEIGEDNEIREHVSIHVGLPNHGGLTSLGHHNLIQNGFHIAHDCRVGSHCVLSGMSGFGGHCIVEDFAVVGAMSGIHQFVRVGESAFTAGNSIVSKDVPPFAKVAGDRARFAGVNTINLERRGFEKDRIAAIKHAFHLLFLSKLPFEEACVRVEAECGESRDIRHLLAFLRSAERGFVR